MKKYSIILSTAGLLLLPTVIFAQPRAINLPIVTVVANLIATALTVVWMVAAAFVVIMFTIAGFKFLTAQGEGSKVNEARQAVIWGVVGVVVIILAWSIVTIVSIQFGVL